jgi:hypothetical protein
LTNCTEILSSRLNFRLAMVNSFRLPKALCCSLGVSTIRGEVRFAGSVRKCYNFRMIEQLLEYLDRDPFQPFRIVTTSGKAYEVQSPHSIAIAESYLFYCFPHSDQSAHVRLNQIVALETMHQAA